MDPLVIKAVSALQKIFPNGFDGCVTFEITDAGPVSLDRTGVHAGRGPGHLVISADADTFVGIISGKLSPVPLYISGRLSIRGDLHLAARLAEQLK